MKPREEWHLETKHIGRRVLVFDRVDSTNTVAAGMAADQANDGIAILADEQTAGRGQPGRTWHCPPGEGILLSLLVVRRPEPQTPAALTAWAAVSVCQTVCDTTGFEPEIKWPNDVLILDRKVCGILVEQSAGHAVIGIGLNVLQPAEYFTGAGLANAASLAMFSHEPLDRRHITERLLYNLDEFFGSRDSLERHWRRWLGLIGRSVRIACLDGSLHGRVRDASFDALTIEVQDGQIVSIRPETVRALNEP